MEQLLLSWATWRAGPLTYCSVIFCYKGSTTQFLPTMICDDAIILHDEGLDKDVLYVTLCSELNGRCCWVSHQPEKVKGWPVSTGKERLYFFLLRREGYLLCVGEWNIGGCWAFFVESPDSLLAWLWFVTIRDSIWLACCYYGDSFVLFSSSSLCFVSELLWYQIYLHMCYCIIVWFFCFHLLDSNSSILPCWLLPCQTINS